MRILLLVLIAVPAFAKTIALPNNVNSDRMRAEARAAGFSNAEVTMRSGDWKLKYNEADGDPSAVIAAHDPDVEKRAKSALLARIRRLKNGTATAQDRDQLLIYLLRRVR